MPVSSEKSTLSIVSLSWLAACTIGSRLGLRRVLHLFAPRWKADGYNCESYTSLLEERAQHPAADRSKSAKRDTKGAHWAEARGEVGAGNIRLKSGLRFWRSCVTQNARVVWLRISLNHRVNVRRLQSANGRGHFGPRDVTSINKRMDVPSREHSRSYGNADTLVYPAASFSGWFGCG